MSPATIPEDLAHRRQQNALTLWLRWRLADIAKGNIGTDRSFSAQIGMSPTQWSNHKSGKPLGDKLARQMELACGVEAGWLDQNHSGLAFSYSNRTLPDTELATPEALARALSIDVEDLVRGLGMAVSPTAAGFPSPAAEHQVKRLDLNSELVSNDEATMLVRVRGDSMRDAGIHDGNILVVDKSLTPRHGDMVVAVLDEEFTVKQLYLRDGIVKLVPANPDFEEIVPQLGQELRIWGVVTSTVKQFR